ncbi:hypothetical protein DFJ73DRAFT_765714 [Zopfochytrium polystomum]|nr:hypothetical protein DFJ73DRAFT_765714 [Zopfochytrium polystomum]
MSTTQPPTQIPFASRNMNTSRPTAQFPPATGKIRLEATKAEPSVEDLHRQMFDHMSDTAFMFAPPVSAEELDTGHRAFAVLCIYAYRCQVFHNMFANCDFWHVVNFLLTDYDSMDSDEQADLLQRYESQFLPGAAAPDGPDGSRNAAGKSDSSKSESVGEGDSDGDSEGTANDSMAAQAP